MHELSIAMSIVDIATDAVRNASAHQVEEIELDIGTMAGVEFEALEFAWSAAVQNTVLQQAEKIINRIPATGRCTACGCEFPVENILAECPLCGEYLFQYVTGKELRVKSLVVS